MNIDTICLFSTIVALFVALRPFVRKKAFLSTASKLDSPMLTM